MLKATIFTREQTAALHFTGLVMVLERISEAKKVMVFIVKCPIIIFAIKYLYRVK